MSEVWNKLSDIDVNEHTEKKGRFTYLSWAWAWGIVKENYPEATYEIHDNIFYPDDSVETRMSVTIEGQTHTMWLPVMDNKNNPIHGPNSRDINDARMRCFVKAIAMHGLGHYIYAGEDVPQSHGEPHTEPVEDKSNPVAPKQESAIAQINNDIGLVVNTFAYRPEDKQPRSFSDWDSWADVMCSWVKSGNTEAQLKAFYSKNKTSFSQAKKDALSKYEQVIEAMKNRKEAITKKGK